MDQFVFFFFFFQDYVQKQHLSSLTLENMWSEIFELEYSPGLPAFSNSHEVVNLVMILPHSNAEAERTFSNVTDIVTKKRNRIGSDTVAAICKVRSSFVVNDVCCFSFRADFLHLTLYDKISFQIILA